MQDIKDIILTHEGRLLRLGELCDVNLRPLSGGGIVRHDGCRAVTMAVVKQSEARMEDLQAGMDTLLTERRAGYPEIFFDLTRDQTRLLTYSMENLQTNLLLGAALACLVLFVFMRSVRLPLLIIITIPLSLILTILSFYILGISLNVISLSGLILGVGMIVDNSIIVIVNIRQRMHYEPLDTAVVRGARGSVPTHAVVRADHMLGVSSLYIPERHSRRTVLRSGHSGYHSPGSPLFWLP